MKTLISMIALVALSTGAQAADTYKIDPIHSVVRFQVSHKGAGYVDGRFNQFEGSFTIDEANPAKSALTLTVQAASVDTGFEKRDQHIKSPDFLNAKQFPTIVFKTTGIQRIGDKKATVQGELTLLGVTKKITAEAALSGKQGDLLGLEAETVIKRSDFGSKYGIPMLGDEVRIYVAVEGGKE